MSCLPLPNAWNPQSDNVECFFMDTEVISAVTCDEIKMVTRVEPVLSKVYTFVLNGWPNSPLDPQFRPYKERQHELSVEQGCILWGMRVVVPDCLRTKVLDVLDGATKANNFLCSSDFTYSLTTSMVKNVCSS